eukprot:TRINITY_DN1128_c0_g1_i1.p1 TRINITY_DN1128_c0_g1~~TRINITY_DN1128_c0_g1_i1.p1  ORF type:complete len:618 (-),score=139.11 TRINITY_DN1128_c0_g1_i1:19-1872(-)
METHSSLSQMGRRLIPSTRHASELQQLVNESKEASRTAFREELDSFAALVFRPALEELRRNVAEDLDEVNREPPQGRARLQPMTTVLHHRRSSTIKALGVGAARARGYTDADVQDWFDANMAANGGCRGSDARDLCFGKEEEHLLSTHVISERHDEDVLMPDAAMRIGIMLRFKSVLSHFVHMPAFDYMVSFCVVLNAFVIGFETDWMAQHVGDTKPKYFFWVDVCFGAFFLAELLMRIFVFGHAFFHSQDWAWNSFDATVVCLQVFDLLSCAFPGYIPRDDGFVHTLRLVRLVRIVRLARVLHLLVELRTMVSSIVGSLRSLFWAIVLYFMLIYTVGVYLAQIITDEREARMNTDKLTDDFLTLERYCGSLWLTIYSLWSCITGGMDWGQLISLLISEISVWMGAQMIVFIAFCMLAMANVITGIFVDSAMTHAHEDQDVYVAKKVIDMFRQSDLSAGGTLSEETFLTKAKSNKLSELFKAINVDAEDAPTIFKLIDVDGNGFVDPVELLDGWLRLRGPAKSLDQQYRTVFERLDELTRLVRWLTSDSAEEGGHASSAAPTRAGDETPADGRAEGKRVTWNLSERRVSRATVRAHALIGNLSPELEIRSRPSEYYD